MKRITAFIIGAVLSSAVFTSCGQPAEPSELPENSAVQQQSGSYEEALKECFNASFSPSGGEIFYSYMYPDVYVDDMKAKDEYEDAVLAFNKNQAKRPELTDGSCEFGSITESKDINDSQKEAVKKYFTSKCQERGMDVSEDSFDVKEGYEVSYTYTENGENSGSDHVLAVRINDEGWKIITG